MDKRIYITVIIILIVAVLALLAYNNFEIYPVKKYIYPSDEVQRNSIYALEKWLNEEGFPVRTENYFELETITEIPEKIAVIHSLASEWDNAEEYLIPWIEKGNSLVIYMSGLTNEIEDDLVDLIEFLFLFGIKPETTYYSSEGKEDDIPSFHWYICFSVEEENNFFTIKDEENYIRLVEVNIGEGLLTVIGTPVFMYNYNIKKEINARLAWKLTGERANEEGMLFVFRPYRSNTYNVGSGQFLARIIERGNLLPIGISAFLAIILGFWMVIPVYGLLLEEKQKSSRPIKERFAAETSFLKKYGALNYYLETYKRELKLDEDTKNYTYREIINKIRSVYDGKIKR